MPILSPLFAAKKARALPIEAALLLELAGDPSKAATHQYISHCLAQGIDWPQFIRLVDDHQILPLIYHTLKGHFWTLVPEAARDELRAFYRAISVRNLFFTQELLKLLALLESHHITAVPFKGPILAATAYGSASLRQFNDLDILVRRRDVAPTQALLSSLGYHPEKRLEWEISLINAKLGVGVDLHWAITPQDTRAENVSFSLPIEEMLGRLQPVILAGQPVDCFTPEDMLLIQCYSSIKDRFRTHMQLKWLCDIDRIIRAHPALNWQMLMGQATQSGSQRLLYTWLHLVSEVCQTDIPDSIRATMQTDARVRTLAADLRAQLFVEPPNPKSLSTFFKRYWYYMGLKERPRDKRFYAANMVRYVLKPSAKDKACVRLPPWLGFCYYLVRPLRLCGVIFSPNSPTRKPRPIRAGRKRT